MLERIRYRIHVWRVTRALRRAENPRLSHTVRVREARRLIWLVNQ